MTDTLTPEERSRNMSKIHSKDTKPELLVRHLLHKMGYRFRLQGKISKRIYKKGVLPGKPDIVLKKYRSVIFVHGCFWHRHENCKTATMPKTHTEFWQKKFNRNVERDAQNRKILGDLGWRILIIWECELKDLEKIEAKIRRFLTVYAEDSEKVELMAAESEEKYGISDDTKINKSAL